VVQVEAEVRATQVATIWRTSNMRRHLPDESGRTQERHRIRLATTDTSTRTTHRRLSGGGERVARLEQLLAADQRAEAFVLLSVVLNAAPVDALQREFVAGRSESALTCLS
jgi:hypothetical protein